MAQTILRSLLKTRHDAEEAASGLPDLMIAAQKAAMNIMSGEHAQRKSGAGEKFWQFREYTSGDRPQDIDWRQSAKNDRLYVRQKEWQTTQTALFWCQNNDGMSYSSAPSLPAKQEVSHTLALALGILMTHAGERIGLLGNAMQPGRSDLALQKLGESLLTMKTDHLPDPAASKIPRHSNLVIIGDFLSKTEETERVFSQIAARATPAIIIQVLDPAELNLPFTGRVIFEERTQRERHHVTHVESIRTAYQDRIRNHLDEIKALCQQQGWHWLLHSTDQNIRDTLFDAWMMLGPDNFHAGDKAI